MDTCKMSDLQLMVDALLWDKGHDRGQHSTKELTEHYFSQDRRFCYWVPSVPNEQGLYVPSLVFEYAPSHFPCDYDWGSDRKIAEQCALDKNTNLGLSARDVFAIQASSQFFWERARTPIHRLPRRFVEAV